jgi:hypothetical protein
MTIVRHALAKPAGSHLRFKITATIAGQDVLCNALPGVSHIEEGDPLLAKDVALSTGGGTPAWQARPAFALHWRRLLHAELAAGRLQV